MVESTIFCDMHGDFHERRTDPYGYGDPDDEVENCGPDAWRNLFILSNGEDGEY
jgi:hypothetical protein